MSEENIYEYILQQKQEIELECLKLNTSGINNVIDNDKNKSFDLIFPDNINEMCNFLSNYHKEKTDELQHLKKMSVAKDEKNKVKNDKTPKLFLSLDYIIDNISSDDYSNGIYGVLNYYQLSQKIDQSKANQMIIKYIADKNIEYYNKAPIVSKIISKGNFTSFANENNYGFVFLYEKSDDDIVELNKVYLMKDANINFINKVNVNNDNDDKKDSEENLSETDETDDEKTITKIYHFISEKKISLKDVIYESSFENDAVEINENLNSTNKSAEIKLEENIANIASIITECENLNKLVKKYKKYLNDNVKSDDIKETLNNFTNIKTLIKKILDPTKCVLDINSFAKYEWKNKFSDIKISNRYNEPEYSNLIKKYFDDSISNIVDNLLDIYNLNNLFKTHIETFVEILLRAYIDEHLKYQSYCFGKNLCEYLKLSSVMPEPSTQTIALKKRYWSNSLESSDNKKFVISLLNTLNSKTSSLDETLKYLSSLEIDILMPTINNTTDKKK